MGQIAEDMIDGTCCSLCGLYFIKKGKLYTHGHEVACWECYAGLTEEEKKYHPKAKTGTY